MTASPWEGVGEERQQSFPRILTERSPVDGGSKVGPRQSITRKAIPKVRSGEQGTEGQHEPETRLSWLKNSDQMCGPGKGGELRDWDGGMCAATRKTDSEWEAAV